MPRFSPILLPIVFTLPYATAFADITPQELWDNLQTYSETFGQTLTADIAYSGDTLVASNVVLKVLPSENTPAIGEAHFPTLALADTGAGSVQITLPNGGTYTAAFPATETGSSPDLVVNLTATGAIIASGTPDEITYTFDDAALSYSSEEVQIDGATTLPNLLFTAQGIEGTIATRTQDGTLHTATNVTAQNPSYTIEVTDEDAAFQSSYTAAAIKMESSSSAPITPLKDPRETLKKIRAYGQYTLTQSAFDFNFADQAAPLNISGTSQSDTFDFNFDAGVVSYGSLSKGSEILAKGPALPVPQIDLGIEEASFSATHPLTPSNDPQSAELKLGLNGVRVPQIAWAILDPQSQLPHDLANIQIDLSGSVISDIDFLSPVPFDDTLQDQGQYSPVSLALNSFLFNFAGAELSAEGNAEFAQNTNLESPFPKADAQMAVKLSGITPLIETLAQSGVIPAQMVATAQFMLSAFARPGEGPDTYESDIKFDQQGTISVNGLPLPF